MITPGAVQARLHTVAALLLVAACSSSEEVVVADPALPPEAEWIAAALLDARGELLASTGLSRRVPGQALRLALPPAEGEGAALWITGYRTIDLAPHDRDPQTLATSRLTLATPTGPALPAPIWSRGRSVQDGRTGGSLSGAPPELAAPWLPPCPEIVSGRAKVDFGCSPAACSVPARQDGCTLILDATACLFGNLTAGIDGRGRVTFFPGQQVDGCFERAPEPPALKSITCRDELQRECPVRIYDGSPVSHFEIVTTPVVEPEAPHLGTERPVRGHLSGLVVRGDRVWVSSYGGAISDWLCQGSTPGELIELDADSMQVLRRVPAPPCLVALEPDPSGPGLIGVFGGTAQQHLGRFDGSGTLTASAAIAHESFVPEHAVTSLLSFTSPEPGIAAALSVRQGGARGRVVFFDPETLEVSALSQPYGNRLFSLAQTADGSIVVLDEDLDGVPFLDTGGGERDVRSLRGPCGSAPLGGVELRTGAGSVLLVTALRAAGFYVSSVDACTRALYFEARGDPYSLLPWRGDRVIVGLRQQPESSAVLAVADLTRVRFLPGFDRVGRGVPAFLRLDAAGRIFGATPGDGSVFRATPR